MLSNITNFLSGLIEKLIRIFLYPLGLDALKICANLAKTPKDVPMNWAKISEKIPDTHFEQLISKKSK